jgi:hypothetical protein
VHVVIIYAYGGKEWNDWAKNYLNNAHYAAASAHYATFDIAAIAAAADATSYAHYADATFDAHYATASAHYAAYAAIAAHSDATSYVARYATHAAISAVSACREDYMNLTDIIKEL